MLTAPDVPRSVPGMCSLPVALGGGEAEVSVIVGAGAADGEQSLWLVRAWLAACLG